MRSDLATWRERGMRILADENVDAEWIRALVDDGHCVVRVAESEGPSAGAADRAVLAEASERGRVLLTADQADFADPPIDDHSGIVVVADVTRTGGEIRRGIQRIGRSVDDVSGHVLFLSDWL